MFRRCSAFSTCNLEVSYVWAWRCSGMFFAKLCRHFDSLLEKKYTCSGEMVETKVVPELEFEEV